MIMLFWYFVDSINFRVHRGKSIVFSAAGEKTFLSELEESFKCVFRT